jgi:hypothetical protein
MPISSDTIDGREKQDVFAIEVLLLDATTLPERKSFFIAIIIALTLLAVVNSGTNLSVWTVLALRPFMHGVSLFKTDFLLVFLLLAAIGSIFEPTLPRRTLSAYYRAMIAAVLIGSAVGMATFLSLAAKLHLPLSKYAYFFSDGYNSINQFAHLHVTKAGLFHLLTFLGLGQIASHADTGEPFAIYINPALSVAVLLAAAVALFLLLFAAATVIRAWQGWRRVVALIVYSLAGSHTVKCLIDGGPLAHDFLPSIITLCLMFLHAGGRELPVLLKKYWLRITLVVILFLTMISLFSPDVALVVQPQQYGFFFGVYIVLMVMLVADIRCKSWLALIIVPCLVWCGVFYYIHTVPDIAALNRRVAEDDRVYVHGIVTSSGDTPMQSVDEITDVRDGERIIDAYLRNGENPLRNRALMIKTEGKSPYSGFLFALRILKSDSVLNLCSTKYLTIRGFTSTGESNDSVFVFRVNFDPTLFPSFWQSESTIIDENNKFAMLYFLNSYFAEHGIHDYVLVPLYYEDLS